MNTQETLSKNATVDSSTNQHEEWFSSFMQKVNDHIKTDKQNLESGNADRQTVEFYSSLIAGDHIRSMGIARKSVSENIIQTIIIAYLKQIREFNIPLLKLAIDISSNKVLIWAEINDNDEKSELALIRAESIINGKFSNEVGIYLDSIIVENTDKMPIPSHYKSVSLN